MIINGIRRFDSKPCPGHLSDMEMLRQLTHPSGATWLWNDFAPFEGLTPRGSKCTVARLRSSRIKRGRYDSSYTESASDLASSHSLRNLR
jgi:hypothetical protein